MKRVWVWVVNIVTALWNVAIFATDWIGRASVAENANSLITLLHRFLDATPWWLPPTTLAFVLIGTVFWPLLSKKVREGSNPVTFSSQPTKQSGLPMSGDDRSVRNIHGNSGVINTGDIYQRAPSRSLTEELRRELLRRLDPELPVRLEVSADQEAEKFAAEIENFIGEHGFTDIHKLITLQSWPVRTGQAVFKKDGENVISIGVQEV